MMGDRVVFLNSSGAIIANVRPTSDYIPWFGIAPYVENVMLPVVSVDSSALYGDHPENLATLTYSSGAALTFFCDSEAGGTNTSGDGSFDNPWRSLKTASDFLSCGSCVLTAAAPYIQLKVKGTVDYMSGATWEPFNYLAADKLILAGWGEKINLSSGGQYRAKYMIGVEGYSIQSSAVYHNCRLSRWGTHGSTQSAVECYVDCPSGHIKIPVAMNCSGGRLSASVVSGGSFSSRVDAKYVCGGSFAAAASHGGVIALYLSTGGAVCSAAVVVPGGTSIVGISGNTLLIRDCVVSVIASDSQTSSETGAGGYAGADGIAGSAITISGGVIFASANAYASGFRESAYFDSAAAYATARCMPDNATAYNVNCTATASATAIFTMGSGVASAKMSWCEIIGGGADSCCKYLGYSIVNGVSSGYTSSSGVCP